MSSNPLYDFLKNVETRPGFNDGGYVDTDNIGTDFGDPTMYAGGDPNFNENYSNEGRNKDPLSLADINDVNYSNEGRNFAQPEGAVGTTPDGKNWVDQLGRIIGPVVATLTTPWLNNLQSGGLLSEGRDLLRKGASVWDNANFTDISKLIPQLQMQVMQGTMTPAQAQAVLQQASEMNKVVTDAQSLAAQRAGLARLNDIATNAGMTEQDRAQLTETMNQTNANAAAQRAAQIQALQQQGNAGTGAELAARLMSGQAAGNANALAGANIASSAQARALNALQAGIQGNANLNQQQWQQAAERAKAQDTVNQFNANAQNQIAMANQQAQQQANLANFNMANTIAGKNTEIANQQAMLPMNAANTMNELQLKRAGGASGSMVNAGKAMINQGNTQATNTATAAGKSAQPSGGGSSGGGLLDTIGKGVGIIQGISSLFSDERLKTDKKELTDDDIDGMMANLTGYRYRYKGQGNQPTEGIMAQDMEKSGWGNSVVDTPAGKMLSGNETMGKALAVLANQNERLRKLEGKY